MKTIIENIYAHTNNRNPRWKLQSTVTITVYEFDICDSNTGEVVGTTYLHHRYDSTKSHNMYHGCEYRFSGHNPTPVTDWFRGVPLKQMFKWCADHHMYNRTPFAKYVTNKWVDVSTTI